MSGQPGRSGSRRRRGRKVKSADLWRPYAPLDPPAPISRANDATVVIRSLGSPPLKGQGSLAEQHLALAVDRAADTAANALALAAGLLAAAESDDDVDV